MDDNTLILSEKRRQLILWILLCLVPIIGMAVDLVAPSLPAIANELQVTNGIAKDIITIYLFGYICYRKFVACDFF